MKERRQVNFGAVKLGERPFEMVSMTGNSNVSEMDRITYSYMTMLTASLSKLSPKMTL